MKRNCFILITVLISVLSASCGMKNSVIIPYRESSSDDIQSVVSAASGKQQWRGTDFAVVEEEDEEEDSSIEAGAALLCSLDKPDTIYVKNPYQHMNPASLTMLFTAYLVLQEKNLTDIVTVPPEAVAYLQNSTTVGLKGGDQVTVEQLLYGMLLGSGVDAANVLAAEISGSRDAFVRKLNETAADCGFTDTQFQNPSGITRWGHYTSVYDIYMVVKALMNDERFLNIISAPSYTCTYKNEEGATCTAVYESNVRYAQQKNSKIGSVQILGGKSGETNAAGNCLALICQGEDGTRYLAVALRTENEDSLYRQIEHIVKKIEK